MAVWLFILQRGSALVMAPLVLIHIGVMVVAVRNGLSSEEILGRTQGSVFWADYGCPGAAARAARPGARAPAQPSADTGCRQLGGHYHVALKQEAWPSINSARRHGAQRGVRLSGIAVRFW